MIFIFKAKTAKGDIKKGKIEALSREAAISTLQDNNLIPIFITQQKEENKILKDLKRVWEGVTTKDLMFLFRQLATLIGARVPIVSSLKAIGDQSNNQYLKEVLVDIVENVEDGMSLSEAMKNHPDVFSSIEINLIAAGEVSGGLQKTVEYIADNIEKNYKLTSKVRGALFYPAFVITASGIIGFLTITFILPNITAIIKDMDLEVAWYTKALMALGDFMKAYWWAVLIAIFSLIGGFIYYVNTEAGKKDWDIIQLKIPVIGKILRYVYLSRFGSNLAILLKGGLPVVKALIISSSVVGNSVYRAVILKAADEVKTGGTMSSYFQGTKEIPPIVTKMIKVGEETGKLDESLMNVANFYEGEADNMVRNLSSLIEPVLIVILGIGVAILIFGIMMPIYSIVDQL